MSSSIDFSRAATWLKAALKSNSWQTSRTNSVNSSWQSQSERGPQLACAWKAECKSAVSSSATMKYLMKKGRIALTKGSQLPSLSSRAYFCLRRQQQRLACRVVALEPVNSPLVQKMSLVKLVISSQRMEKAASNSRQSSVMIAERTMPHCTQESSKTLFLKAEWRHWASLWDQSYWPVSQRSLLRARVLFRALIWLPLSIRLSSITVYSCSLLNYSARIFSQCFRKIQYSQLPSFAFSTSRSLSARACSTRCFSPSVSLQPTAAAAGITLAKSLVCSTFWSASCLVREDSSSSESSRRETCGSWPQSCHSINAFDISTTLDIGMATLKLSSISNQSFVARLQADYYQASKRLNKERQRIRELTEASCEKDDSPRSNARVKLPGRHKIQASLNECLNRIKQLKIEIDRERASRLNNEQEFKCLFNQLATQSTDETQSVTSTRTARKSTKSQGRQDKICSKMKSMNEQEDLLKKRLKEVQRSNLALMNSLQAYSSNTEQKLQNRVRMEQERIRYLRENIAEKKISIAKFTDVLAETGLDSLEEVDEVITRNNARFNELVTRYKQQVQEIEQIKSEHDKIANKLSQLRQVQMERVRQVNLAEERHRTISEMKERIATKQRLLCEIQPRLKMLDEKTSGKRVAKLQRKLTRKNSKQGEGYEAKLLKDLLLGHEAQQQAQSRFMRKQQFESVVRSILGGMLKEDQPLSKSISVVL